MRLRLIVPVSGILLLSATSAHAQLGEVVTDPGAYAHMIDQVVEARNQLVELRAQVEHGKELIGQGKALFDSLNKAADVNSIGGLLSTPAVRSLLPAEFSDAQKLMSADLQSLGSLASRATAIRDANRIYTSPNADGLTEAEEYYRTSLEKAGVRAARDMAVGERVTQTADQRVVGLEQLRQALSSAPNARAVLDLQARISAETAMIQNDQMRLQGVAMMQGAEERLRRQREEEQAAKMHDATIAAWDEMARR